MMTERRGLHLLLVVCISDTFIAPIVHLMPVIADIVLGDGPEVSGFLVLATAIDGIIATISFASLGGAMGKGLVGLVALILLVGGVGLHIGPGRAHHERLGANVSC